MINRLKVQTASVVVPIGLLHMGAARHRALLYKVLADDLGMPCRILKGEGLPGGRLRVAGRRRRGAGRAAACAHVAVPVASPCAAAGM